MFAWSVEPAPVETAACCGQIVTQSIELTQDLADCAVFGLVVGAARITIDLRGYTIDGVLGSGVGHEPFLRDVL